MGIFVDYTFYRRCAEDELVERMGRLREQILGLDLQRVGEIIHVEPVCALLVMRALEREGLPIPPAVRARIGPVLKDRVHGELCLAVAPMDLSLPEDLEDGFFSPARALIERTDLWDPSAYPEWLKIRTIRVNREFVLTEFACALLRHGYAMIVDPGEGCESVVIGLSSLRGEGTPVWAGCSFTKTQYAVHFVDTHEKVCRILDFAREVGLLHSAEDTCEFYEHRDWARSAPIVNHETIGARIVSKLIDKACEDACKAGVLKSYQVLQDNAGQTTNIVRVSKGDGRRGGRPSRDADPNAPRS